MIGPERIEKLRTERRTSGVEYRLELAERRIADLETMLEAVTTERNELAAIIDAIEEALPVDIDDLY